MRGHSSVRRLRWILILLPALATFAAAQGPPPPPPPPLQPLPPPPAPPANPVTTAKANLGKVLFWDEQLSSTRTVACGSCHQARLGGTDPRTQAASLRATHPGPDGVSGTADDVLGSPGVSLNEATADLDWSALFGIREQVTGRRSPSHINAAYSPELFWDGRAQRAFRDPISGDTLIQNGGALENQASGPPVSSAEMGHLGRDWNDVAARVAASRPLAQATYIPSALASWIGGRSYPALFLEAFASADVTPARIAMAIATYERTQFSNQTPFDSSIAGTAALTPQENAGRQLFGVLPCARCHAGALTSDNAFHYIGVRPAPEDSGRMVVTHAPVDLGAFKTPSLRNVALRPSLMHNGEFHSLAEVVDFYDRGGDFNAPNKSPLITPLNLTPPQKAALVAFMSRPLTDPRVAAGTSPFDRPLLYSETELVPVVLGGGVAGTGGIPQPVALQPPIAGNPAFTVGLYGALAGGHAVLVIDEVEPAEGAIPASGSFARIETTLKGSGGGDGFGSVTLAIPDDAALFGRVLYGRWYVEDGVAAGGVASSPLFRFKVFGSNGQGVLAVDDGGVAPKTPRALRLFTGQPNPFRARTVIAFDLFTPSRVKLGIYDLSGRLIRTLVDVPLMEAGSHTAEWDGRDDSGGLAAPGVYFSRLEGGGTSEAYRVVRLE
jgi:cytochrome c peroxidase